METDKLTYKEYQAIFDVLNVYDPNDIKHIYPEMGNLAFLKDVRSAWEKVHSIVNLTPVKNRK
tara:strand:- start:674 stop:862 length:189 start_codon:yes stop_codon:yes gene_type:complete